MMSTRKERKVESLSGENVDGKKKKKLGDDDEEGKRDPRWVQ